MTKTSTKKDDPKLVPCIDATTGHVKDEVASGRWLPIPKALVDKVKKLNRPRRMSLVSAIRMAPEAKRKDMWTTYVDAFLKRDAKAD